MLALVAAAFLAGCANKESMGFAAADAAAGAPQGRFLAYEHQVTVALDVEALAGRLAEVQSACQTARFGECEVLEVAQHGGDHPSARLVVRNVPAGVGPMVGAASQGGRGGSRSTHAEDLAQAVADNAQAQDRLRREQARLEEFQSRRDLAVADMIALSQQLAQVEAQLQAAAQEAAQQQRRIQTQKLTLEFQPPDLQSGSGEIGQAVRDFVSILATGTAWTIRAVAFLIPLAVVVAVLVAVWRWRKRRRG
ncbi:DUF4349 domain-containing protein [Pseudoxanthomonas jiangsuensis]|uniref:DUF4349 domain-containing protein n=1 Tax=Pseudoxanthomonas jiangsuensis TaxID=619688 RepID=UPI001FEA1A7B|nr:DUF4349 domain-containing protein [Pseudoxanthomonas jiangsuensis]